MLLLDVPDEEVERRLSGRRVCVKKGHNYHVEFDPPKREGVCDQDGSRLIQRDDDKPEVVRNRLEVYHEKTAPLIDYYDDQGLLRRIDGTREPDRGPRSHSRGDRDPADGGERLGMIIKKTPEEIERMAAAGTILVRTMNLLAGKIRPGVTTGELDQAAEKFIRSQGAEPAFKGYRGFPGSICTSPNSMIVHGIPGPYKLARGRHPVDRHRGDPRRVGGRRRPDLSGGPDLADRAQAALTVTEESLFLAVGQCRPGNRLGDVSHAVQAHVEAAGLSVVRTLVGHGIGRSMHEEPQIPNHGEPGTGILLEEGMVLAVEPMVTAGRHGVRVGEDRWSIYSQDGSLTAHFEFTVAVTAEGPRILTPWHEAGGPGCGCLSRQRPLLVSESVRPRRDLLCCEPSFSPVAATSCGLQSRAEESLIRELRA